MNVDIRAVLFLAVVPLAAAGGDVLAYANGTTDRAYELAFSMTGSFALDITGSIPHKYSGGTGDTNDPYQIATVGDVMLLGDSPEDYDKEFVLTADIDLDPNLPGRRVFDRAVIAWDLDPNDHSFQGLPFTGLFDGDNHAILNLACRSSSADYVGLFGMMRGTITNLKLVNPDVDAGKGPYVGPVAGSVGGGTITNCHVNGGSVAGTNEIGGLVGSKQGGGVTNCSSSCKVIGNNRIGGLVGHNGGAISNSYSTGEVSGNNEVGGLAGRNGWKGMGGITPAQISNCYSMGTVVGESNVGGLVGANEVSTIAYSYAAGRVDAEQHVGGLVGSNATALTQCFWDIEVSGQSTSAGGTGRTTAEMKSATTFSAWAPCDTDSAWTVGYGDYPRLSWEGTLNAGPAMGLYLDGDGTRDNPYLIYTVEQLITIGSFPCDWNGSRHFKLMADIDMGGYSFSMAPIAPDVDSDNGGFQGTAFAGFFDGNGHTVSHLTIMGDCYLGLFGRLAPTAQVTNLGVVDVNINITTGPDYCIGALAGENSGLVSHCYSTGLVGGSGSVGGLIGKNSGSVSYCYSAGGTVFRGGTVFTGGATAGGLIGQNDGTVSLCYSANAVIGDSSAGGLIGANSGSVTSCVWDVNASGQTWSAGGIGLTAEQMIYPDMYGLNGDWAMDPSWVMDVGNDYPRLAWEGTPGQPIPEPTVDWLAGTGASDDPYVITNSDQLILISQAQDLWSRHFKLEADISFEGTIFPRALIPEFSGTFDGNNHTISDLRITGDGYLGLFGRVLSGAEVHDLGVVNADISRGGSNMGILAAQNDGVVTTCYTTGVVEGDDYTGGLVGVNGGSVTNCYSTSRVLGDDYVGGLVGSNNGTLTCSFSSGVATGRDDYVGGLAGSNRGNVTSCYSTGSASGDYWIGGLVGENEGDLANCYSAAVVSGNYVGGLVAANGGTVTYCVWDAEISGQAVSAAGVGLTTAQMMDPMIHGLNGWAMNQAWVLDAGNDYPRLAWQKTPGQPIPEPAIDWLAGTGTPEDPYRIENTYQLVLIGKASVLWGDCFKLVADIEMAGTRVFGPVIPEFSGAFDGNHLTISNLTISGGGSLGLFGKLASGADIHDLGLVDIHVTGAASQVGALAGENSGNVSRCYSTGTVSGDDNVGGLVGSNSGGLTNCHSTSRVQGDDYVGGLIGSNNGTLAYSYSTGAVSGRDDDVGGLVGSNNGNVTSCYSTGSALGDYRIGGLVGSNGGNVTSCYSSCVVAGRYVGGLIASNGGRVTNSVWDIEVSRQVVSAAGVGLTTAQMMDPVIYGLNGWAMNPDWVLDAGNDYPRLAWQGTPGRPVPEPAMDWIGGTGTRVDPYRIEHAHQLVLISKATALWGKCFRLTADIDMSDASNAVASIPEFAGSFDGNKHTISNLTVTGNGTLGLFGRLLLGAEVCDLGMVGVSVTGSGSQVGAIVGENGGAVTRCYSTGSVSGDDNVGGLVGVNNGSLTYCYSSAAVSGDDYVGGLAGSNNGTLSHCYSNGDVSGRDDYVGGVAGSNSGSVTNCYSAGSVSGDDQVAGLIGSNSGKVINCYSTSVVSGDYKGGLVASNSGEIVDCFWNTETSGQTRSAGGIGLTTVEMMGSEVYGLNRWALNADWVLDVGNDYPHLAWEGTSGQLIPEPTLDWIAGAGTEIDPHQLANADQLYLIGKASILWDKAIALTADVDLSGMTWSTAVIPVFSGSFNGNGHVIRNLQIANGESYVGLFGRIVPDAEVYDLGIVDANVGGMQNVGILAGQNEGIVRGCYSTGVLRGGSSAGGLVGSNPGSLSNCLSISSASGNNDTGGLVGSNSGSVNYCCSNGDVSGNSRVGGLLGSNSGSVMYSYSVGVVSGNDDYIGGLAGLNSGDMISCYSTGSASGDYWIGGLAGSNSGSVTRCYSAGSVSGDYVGGLVATNSGIVTHGLWDIERSGQNQSEGGVGLTTSEMMDAEMCGLNGWAADPNWVLDPGKDYPRLAWEGSPGQLIPEPTIDWLVGTGTEERPYQLTDVDQFALIARASILWDDCIELTQDIDLAGRTWPIAVIPAFSGTFYGRGYAVRNLKILGRNNLGLFGEIRAQAQIADIDIVEADVNGTGENIGILAGKNMGFVIGCHTTGAVSGNWNVGGMVGNNMGRVVSCDSAGTVTGDSATGGLLGHNAGDVVDCHSTCAVSGDYYVGGLMGNTTGSVVNCFSTGDVSGNNSVGGLAGQNGNQAWAGGMRRRWWGTPVGSNAGLLINCYSTGSVSGDNTVGGLVGSNNSGRISNCYSTGGVFGHWNTGGLVGENSGNIHNCYSVGTVLGGDDAFVCGLVGQNSIVFSVFHGPSFSLYGSVSNSFWDTETSAVAESDGGEGLSTAQMQNVQTFLEAGWDFLGVAEDGLNEIWQMSDQGGYPILSVFNGYEPLALAGEGTVDSPYLVSTATELGAVLHNDTKAYYRLTTDLNLSGITWSMPAIPTFAGDFDGNGFVVRGLTISQGDNIGLFGQIAPEAHIHDLGVVDAEVSGGTHVGALAGLNDHGIVSNCFSTGSISGDVSTGGLIGYANGGTIADCRSTATVSGGLNSGGLLGYIVDGDVIGCNSTGSVSGQDYVGGLVGDNSGKISKCHSSSDTSGDNEVGGLVGVNNRNVSRSCSSGTVSGNDLVGGLIGNSRGSNVDNCYSRSPVSGNSEVGGLVGNNGGTVVKCYSTGVVSGNANVGGLIGLNNGQAADCFWDTETSLLTISSAGEGQRTAALQNILVYLDCGWDFAGSTENGTEDIWFIEGQDYPRLSWEYEQ